MLTNFVSVHTPRRRERVRGGSDWFIMRGLAPRIHGVTGSKAHLALAFCHPFRHSRAREILDSELGNRL